MTEPSREVERWTIRECCCGAIHDRPDAGCPECGSHDYKTFEVVATSRSRSSGHRQVCEELAEEFERRAGPPRSTQCVCCRRAAALCREKADQ